jgi:hypothetical protein
MPSLNVQTNVPLDGVVTSGILKEASKTVANIIGKPESVCLISSLFFAFSWGGGLLLCFSAAWTKFWNWVVSIWVFPSIYVFIIKLSDPMNVCVKQ